MSIDHWHIPNQASDIMTYNDPKQAFDIAIAEGRLSTCPTHPRYAGKYMYMGTLENGRDTFKHIETRQYIGAH